MRNLTILFLVISLSACKEKKQSLFLVEHRIGDNSYSGSLSTDSIRQGIWNYYSDRGNSIDSTVVYENGNVAQSKSYWKGQLYSKIKYGKNGEFSEIIISNLCAYREIHDLACEPETPSVDIGKRIFRKNCNGCHNFSYAKQFAELYPKYEKFLNQKMLKDHDSTILITSKEEKRLQHLVVEVLTQSEIQSLVLFLKSDEMTRTY